MQMLNQLLVAAATLIITSTMAACAGSHGEEEDWRDRLIERLEREATETRKQVRQLRAKAERLSPVKPVAETLADSETIERLVQQLQDQDAGQECSGVTKFLIALNRAASGETTGCYGDPTWTTLAEAYKMNSLALCEMQDWALVWYHTAVVTMPEQLRDCGDMELQVATATITYPYTFTAKCGELCNRSGLVSEDVRAMYGERIYPGVADYKKAAAKVREIGMKGYPEDPKVKLAFVAYYDAVSYHTFPTQPAIYGHDPYDNPSLDVLEKVELWFPFGMLEWYQVKDFVYGIGCSAQIAEARRQRFLDTFHHRLMKSSFWKEERESYWAREVPPKTVKELCQE